MMMTSGGRAIVPVIIMDDKRGRTFLVGDGPAHRVSSRCTGGQELTILVLEIEWAIGVIRVHTRSSTRRTDGVEVDRSLGRPLHDALLITRRVGEGARLVV